MLFIIALTAFAASMLTFFSGFGLGTLLTPVFGLFFPIQTAIALTGIVHLLNNLFKISLVRRHIDLKTVRSFGIPSVIGGVVGAWLLTKLSNWSPIYKWSLNAKVFEISPMKLCIGIVMLFFALMELIPLLKNWKAKQSYQTAGGLISGFFGGLSGHQGALRSAFLVNAGLTKEVFIGTGVAIACLVDLTRLPVYFTRMKSFNWQEQAPLLSITVLAAFAGAYFGSKFMKKVTLTAVQIITAVMIISIAVLLMIGII